MQKSGGKRRICHLRDGKLQIVQYCKRCFFIFIFLLFIEV